MNVQNYNIVLEQQEVLNREKKYHLNVKDLPGAVDKFSKENISTAIDNIKKFPFKKIPPFKFRDQGQIKTITGDQLQLFFSRAWIKSPDNGIDIFTTWNSVTTGKFSNKKQNNKEKIVDYPTNEIYTSFQNWISKNVINKENSPILFVNDKEWVFIKQGNMKGAALRTAAGTLVGLGKVF